MKRSCQITHIESENNFFSIFLNIPVPGAVGWGTTLQAGLTPSFVIGIFHLPNPSGRTEALGSTQPLK
jgi:hypothetical protein